MTATPLEHPRRGPHMVNRRDRRLQYRHDQRCPPSRAGCVCACTECDWLPRTGQVFVYHLTGVRQVGGEWKVRHVWRGRIDHGPVPLPFRHRRRRW